MNTLKITKNIFDTITVFAAGWGVLCLVLVSNNQQSIRMATAFFLLSVLSYILEVLTKRK